ncbi:MAG: hypothetical protein J5698_05740 [Bacteroidaceae bacterium]|nr:hypothetical protein [Bacteroidaceae bacterium]
MKKAVLIVCSLFFGVALSMAQTNPKPGYIVTNEGDTIRGMVDFRTNDIMSKRCDFQANGEGEFKTYVPGEIRSFRFDHNGKYFVSRRFEINGDSQLYFAEFMVEGLMNLYCIADKYAEYFFFEREDGEMAQLTSRSLLSSSSIEDVKGDLEEKKEQHGKVKLLLQDSWKAVEDMNKTDLSRKQLVKTVRDYHNDVCTDGSSCMIYEYKEESDKIRTHLKAFAGYDYYSHERTVFQDLGAMENYFGSAFEVGLGIETDIERVIKGGSLEVGLAYSPKASFEHEVMVKGGHEPSLTVYEKSRLIFSAGVVKRFGNGKITPLVRGGGCYVYNMGNTESRYYMSHWIVEDKKWDNTAHAGVYLGGGAQMAVGKHCARLHADVYKSLEALSLGNMVKWSLTAEFVL